MKKRGQNEGTIRKRVDGRWEARAIIGRTIDGKPKFKYIYRKTRAEVASELSKVLAELAEDAYIDETKVTFVGWLKTWLETYAKPSIKLSTYTSYETYIRGHITPYFKNLKLKDLNPKILQDFFNTKLTGGRLDNKEGGLSDKTFKNHYNKILLECGLINLKPKTIRDKIKKGLKSKPKPKGGSPNVTFHTLRHTFATRAIEQGMDVLVLSKILGHSDPSTTLNKYGHVLPNHKKDNMEKIRELYFV